MSLRKVLRKHTIRTLEEYEMSEANGVRSPLHDPLDHTNLPAPPNVPSNSHQSNEPFEENNGTSNPSKNIETAGAGPGRGLTARHTPTSRRTGLKDEWAPARAFYQIVDSNTASNPFLKLVISDFIGFTETTAAAHHSQNYQKIRNEINSLFQKLTQRREQLESLEQIGCIESICKSIHSSLRLSHGTEKRNVVKRYLRIGEESEVVLRAYRQIYAGLHKLVLNLDFDHWKINDESRMALPLDHRLRPSVSARFDSAQSSALGRRGCTPGTRIDALHRMIEWLNDNNTTGIYWLNGMAGTGKTTVAYSVCAELAEERRLTASFFCSRSLPECRNVNQIMPTIAYQLAEFSRPFRCALLGVLQHNRDLTTSGLEVQLERLIIKPLVEVQETLPETLVVVIDALDECDDHDGTSRIIEALLAKTTHLPVKFIVSSRPEPEIAGHMDKRRGKRAQAHLVLHELNHGAVQEDIKTYLRETLAPIQPTDSEVDELAKRADALFIYASTIVRYIGYDNFQSDPRKRLENMLKVAHTSEPEQNQVLDELYHGILSLALDNSKRNEQQREDIMKTLGTVVHCQEQVTVNGISILLGLKDAQRIYHSLRPLSSVLRIIKQTELVTTLHASFSDYLTTENRSGIFFCDPQQYHRNLARRCFNLIQAVPTTNQFNICGLKSSYLFDRQVPDLEGRVETAISRELFYACRHWAAHLSRVDKSSELVTLTESFFSKKLLLWMEVMNLKGYMHEGPNVVQQAGTWLKPERGGVAPDTPDLVHDAWRFVSGYASSSGLQSTPHIYVSALALWSPSSPVGRHYRPRARGLLASGSAINRRQGDPVRMGWLSKGLHMVVWSSDNKRIAGISKDHLFVLDPLSCEMTSDPIKSRGSGFSSVSFSPDGARIACGSIDGTIRVWDERRNEKIRGRMKGHTKQVTSIQYSHDGKHIISGSWDMTVRIWNAQTGLLAYGPLKGHSGKVNSVAYSFDDAHIVSASRDHTMRIWDAESGRLLQPVLRGHTGSVNSAQYSPDNTKIVSGSDDGAVFIWDTSTGQILQRFTGHTNSIESVGYSPDGRYIVSGSWDETVCIWNLTTGKLSHETLVGHTHWVLSVQYSPDGTRILSSSWDGTVRIWDAQTRASPIVNLPFDTLTSSIPAIEPLLSNTISLQISPIENPQLSKLNHCQNEELDLLVEHARSITSIDYSPDGSFLVSGSQDHTLRIWDAFTGQPTSHVLQRHTNEVKVVRYSLDGSQIASGSSDCTILLWQTSSNSPILDPLVGHTGEVLTIAYAPDGNHLVSGSRDMTIRVWDLQSGQSVRQPLSGHTDAVTSVGYSSKGTWIISGSNDNTIRVWNNTETSHPKSRRLTGHSSSIFSIECSPIDDTHFVSGSADKTIRIWDIKTGRTRLGPLRGHSDYVNSVGYSPDGSRIVSGSDDGTICIWDAIKGSLLLGPFKGHTGWVTSVRFSPDGKTVVSSSRDKTIRIWDSQDSHSTSQVNFLRGNSESTGSYSPISFNMSSDGWVLDNNSQLVIWIPPSLRDSLAWGNTILKISKYGNIYWNWNNALFGDAWTDCYQPI